MTELALLLLRPARGLKKLQLWDGCIFPSNAVLSLCSLPGMFAIRNEREWVVSEDFMKAVRKISDNKKLETKMDYKQI